MGGLIGETEPNGSLAQATVLSPTGTMTAAIDPAGDQDWFQITLPGAGRLTATVESPPANMRASIQSYGRHTQWLGVYHTAINPGDEVHIVLDLTEPGTYFLRVNDNANQVSSGNYTLRTEFVPAPDAGEPNPRYGQATLVTGSSMTGRIFPRNDTDFYRIHVNDGSTLELDLTSPAAMRGEVSLFSPDFQWMGVYSTAANAGDTVHLSHALPGSGMYYIRVRDVDNRSHVEAYTLAVSGGVPGFVPAETVVTGEVEDNDRFSAANRINLDTAVTGSIAPAHNDDYFTFVPTQTGRVTIAMEASPANLQLQMRLYNDSGDHIVSSRAGLEGGLFSMTFDVTSLDRHYLMVENVLATESPQTYRFASSVVPVNDPFEPNNDYGDRQPMGDVNQIQAWAFPAGDSDWYQVTVSAPGELEAILNNLPENLTPRIALRDLSMNQLATRVGTAGTDLHLNYTLGEPGTYLLEVRDTHGNASTLPYTLTVFGADFMLFAPVATIDSIDPGAIVVGDSVTLTGSGTDADGTVVGYEWTSSIDGLISTADTFTTSTLSIGTHTIQFRVRDNDGVWSALVSDLLYVGSTVSEEIEPNSSFFMANEIALDRPVTAKTDNSGDHDYFKMYVPGAGRLVAELSNVPTNLRMSMEFYNRYWDWLGIYASAADVGDDVTLTYDVAGPGFVYLRLRDNGNQANEDFTYTLAVNFHPAPDSFEPNPDLQDAVLLPTASVEAYHFPSNDYDWYRIWVPAGNVLEAEVVSVPPDVRAEISLYGPDRQWLGRYETAVNPGDPVSASAAEAPHAGFYFIRVRTVEGLNWADTYILNVAGGNPGFEPEFLPVTHEIEPNNAISLGNDVAPGSPVQGGIEPAGDDDWYRFQMPTAGVVSVDLHDVPATLRAQVRVYRNDMQQLASRVASNPGDPVALDVHVADPGLFHVRVYGADGGAHSPDPYTLALVLTPVADANEPNDRFHDATVMTASNRAQGHLFPTGDYDWYRVHSEAGSTLRVSLGDVPDSIRPQLEIYDHNNQRVTYKLASNDGQQLTLTHEVTETADFSVLVRDVGNNSFSAAPYTLVIDGAIFDSYVPLAVIDSVSPNPADAGTTVTLTGHGDDVDGNITGYEWRSSIDDIFSISQVAETSTLTAGVHTIHFRVRDDAGNWSPEVSTLLYFGVPAPAEIEPNDLAGSATFMELATQYTGDMGRNSDEDWFRIPVPQAGRLTVQASNPVGSTMRTELQFYTPDLDWAGVYVTASNDGDPVTLSWDVGQGGDYFLRVRDASNRAGGEYTISANLVVVPDPYEPNHDFWTASPVAPDDQLQGWSFPRGEDDYYRVELPTPGSLEMALTPVPADLRMQINVYGQDLSWLGVYTTANNAGDDVFLTYDAAEAGTYYLRVRAEDSGSNPADAYTFTTVFTPAPDPFEPNHDALHAPWITSSPIEAYLFRGGEQDWYRLYVPPLNPLEIVADPVPANLRLQLSLYNADIGWMGIYPSAEVEGDPVTLTLADAAGVYYLRVTDRDNDRAPGVPYRLTITGADLDYTPPTTPGTAENEPNNAFASASVIGTAPVTANLGGDDDWFRFVAAEPSELVVQMTVSANHRSFIRLYNANNSQLTYREAENKGDPSGLRYPLGAAGTYYLRIYDADGASSADSYTLDLDLIPAVDAHEPNGSSPEATPVAFGTPTPGLIFPNGDEDWYLLEVTEPGTLVMDVTGVPDNLQMELRLRTPNLDQLLHVQTMHGGDPIHARRDVENPGWYRVQLYDRGGDGYATAPYTFTASLIPAEDANEPNDLWRDATPLATRNQVQGLIHPGGDLDWYRFDVAEPGLVRIQISQTGGINPFLELYNDSRQRLTYDYARNLGDTLLIAHEVPAADTYYVVVSDRGNDHGSTEPYVLTVLGGVFDIHHPIAEMPPAFTPNPALTDHAVRFTAVGTDMDGSVTGYEWTSDLDGVLGSDNPLNLTPWTEGRHRISLRVRDDAGNWSGRVDHHHIVAPSLGAESEYNNNAESALPIPLDEWLVGQVFPSRDEDWFKIHVESCGRVNLLVDAVPATMRAHLTVYDGDGGWIGVYASAENDGDWVDLGFYANPGWYLVKVHDADNQAQDGTYALHCSLEPGYDPYEPNGSFAAASVIEPDTLLTDATICPSGDDDYYRIVLEQPGRLEFELRNLPVTMRGSIQLYGESLEWLGVHNTAINGGDPVPLTYDSGAPGVVYVRVRNEWNAGSPQPYEFRSTFTPVVDSHEPNNSGGQATLLTQQATHGTIFPRGDLDHYHLFIEAGETVHLSLTEMPASMRGEISLYGPDLNWLGRYQAANNPGDNVFLSYTAPTSEMYVIRVDDDANGSHVGPYLLTVTGGDPGYEPPFAPETAETEPNDSWATATDVALDTNASGRIQPANNEDYFRIWLNVPGILQVAHTAIPEEVTSEMWVYNADHSQVGHRRATNPGEDNLLQIPVTAPGHYFIRLRDNGLNNASEAPYNLRVTHTPVVDPHEPNGVLGQATPLSDPTIEGYLFDGSDLDWYRVYVREPGTLALSLDVVPAGNRPHLRLYDANGNQKGHWVNTNPGIGGDDLVVHEVPAPGFFYIRVDDEDDQYADETYTLRVTGADFSRAPLLAPIGDQTIDETIRFTLTVNATDPDNPEDLVFSASNLPPGAGFSPATRTLTWTPAAGQAGTYPGVHFEVSDGTFTDSEDITLTVARLSGPPVLAPIGNQTAMPDVELRFQVSGSDPDVGDTLTFDASGLPSGAAFDPATRTFTWMPGSNQLGLHKNILFRVTDGTWTDFEYIDIEVADADPCAAWLAEHFTEAERNDSSISGMDIDLDEDGATNGQECAADTDPWNPDSVLKITSLLSDDAGTTIYWQGGGDAVQYLERKPALDGSPAGWQVIHTVNPPTPVENSHEDSAGGDSESYYRIRAEKP
jgi:hypothetical protein